jgi:hypothetical protein
MAVTVALRGHALTTLERVLAELGRNSDAGAIDSLLNGYINSASSWFSNQCGRVFHAKDAITEKIAGNGRTRIRIARAPIVEITSVDVDGAALVLDSDYSIWNDNSGHPLQPCQLYRQAGWPWQAARGPGLDTAGIPGEERQNITLVYDGGFVTRAQNAIGGVDGDTAFVGLPVTLPDDIEDAVMMLVTTRWRARDRDLRVQSTGFEASSRTFMGVLVPPEVAAIVANYARVAHA